NQSKSVGESGLEVLSRPPDPTDSVGDLNTLLLPEGEKVNTQKNKGITDEDINKMIAGMEVPNEYKEKIQKLMAVHREVFAHNLSQEFTGGNSHFIPHVIRLTPNHPSLWTPQF